MKGSFSARIRDMLDNICGSITKMQQKLREEKEKSKPPYFRNDLGRSGLPTKRGKGKGR